MLTVVNLHYIFVTMIGIILLISVVDMKKWALMDGTLRVFMSCVPLFVDIVRVLTSAAIVVGVCIGVLHLHHQPIQLQPLLPLVGTAYILIENMGGLPVEIASLNRFIFQWGGRRVGGNRCGGLYNFFVIYTYIYIYIYIEASIAYIHGKMADGATFTFTDKMWACPACTVHNHKQSWECWVCRAPKPDREEWWELTAEGVWRQMPKNDEEPPAESSVQPKKAKDAASSVQPKRTRRPKNKKEEKEMAKGNF